MKDGRIALLKEGGLPESPRRNETPCIVDVTKGEHAYSVFEYRKCAHVI